MDKGDQVYLVTGSNPVMGSPVWAVGVFSTEEAARAWAQKARTRSTILLEKLARVWFDLVDGKVHELLEEEYDLVRKGEMTPDHFARLYEQERRVIVKRLNPWDPEVHLDVEEFVVPVYTVASVPMNPVVDTSEVVTHVKVESEDYLDDSEWQESEDQSPEKD
jgi:hypothetical protein